MGFMNGLLCKHEADQIVIKNLLKELTRRENMSAFVKSLDGDLSVVPHFEKLTLDSAKQIVSQIESDLAVLKEFVTNEEAKLAAQPVDQPAEAAAPDVPAQPETPIAAPAPETPAEPAPVDTPAPAEPAPADPATVAPVDPTTDPSVAEDSTASVDPAGNPITLQ